MAAGLRIVWNKDDKPGRRQLDDILQSDIIRLSYELIPITDYITLYVAWSSAIEFIHSFTAIL